MTARRGPYAALARLLPLAGLVAAALPAALAAQGRVLLHDCVAAGGVLGPLGLRLSVLRDAADCPDGSYGLGTMSQGAVVLLSVAVPVAALYLLLTACGIGLTAVLVRAARQVATLLRRVVPGSRSAARTLPTVRRPRPVATGVVAPWAGRVLVGSIARRGPPVAA